MCFSKNILRLQKSSITQKYAKNRSDFNTINSAGQWPTLRVISLGMRVGPSCQSHQDFRRILTYNLIFMLLVFCKLALVLCTFSTRMFCASRMENGERLTAWQAASTEPMPCLRFGLALQIRPTLSVRPSGASRAADSFGASDFCTNVYLDLVFSLAKSWVCKVTAKIQSLPGKQKSTKIDYFIHFQSSRNAILTLCPSLNILKSLYMYKNDLIMNQIVQY